MFAHVRVCVVSICIIYIYIQKENIRNKTRTVTTAVENPKQIQKAIPKLTDRPGRRTDEGQERMKRCRK